MRRRCESGNRERAIAVLVEGGRAERRRSSRMSFRCWLGRLSDYALFALRKVAEERVGQLTDALLDPSQRLQ